MLFKILICHLKTDVLSETPNENGTSVVGIFKYRSSEVKFANYDSQPGKVNRKDQY